MDLLSFMQTYAIPLFAIAAALLGAVVGGVVSSGNDKRRRHAEIKREVLFDAIDAAYGYEDAMHTFTSNAPHGGSDPDADQAAASAIDLALRLESEMRRARGRVAVIASQRLIDAYAAFERATDDYREKMSEQMADGIFRGEPAMEYLNTYAAALDTFVNAARRELGVRSTVNARNARTWQSPLELAVQE